MNDKVTSWSFSVWPLAVALLFFFCLVPGISADSYVGGIPLTTVQSGTVSGGLYIDANVPSWGPLDVTKTFTSISSVDDIAWARLYVAVYSGNMQNNYRGTATVSFDGNGDGTFETVLGTETLDTPGGYTYPGEGGTGAISVNDHCNRVTSDYLMWYNVTSSITSQTPKARVVTTKTDANFDGRIKLCTLIVAYNDGDSDEVHYWVHQGHDVDSYLADDAGMPYTGETTFHLADITTSPESAILTANHLASNDGTYAWNGDAIPTDPAEGNAQGSYSGYNIWNLTSVISPGESNDLTYNRTGSFYKIPLATLAVKKSPVPSGDLEVTFVNPVTGNVFAKEANTVRITVRNNGAQQSPTSEVRLTASDGFDGLGSVPPIAAGQTTIVPVVDTTVRNLAGGVVTYTATVDPDNNITEINEGNNEKSSTTKTVLYNGYKGARYWEGKSDIATMHTFDLRGGLLLSPGDSTYHAGGVGGSGWSSYTVAWSGGDLPVPEGASIREARLYVPYCWDDTAQIPDHFDLFFNGNMLTPEAHYQDRSNFGGYSNHVYGLLAYNVTPYFNMAGNAALLSKDNVNTNVAMYGLTLAVVFEDSSAPRTQIFLNEGFDILGADETQYATTPEEATAYLPFTGMTVTPGDVSSAFLTTFVPSANGPEGDLIWNSVTTGTNVWDYGSSTGTQVAVDARDMKSSLQASGNEAAIRGTATGATPLMAASHAFLVVEYDDEAPVAAFTASPLSGTAPLEVHFTDSSTGPITSYAWDFTNDGTIDSTVQNPTYTYQNVGTYTVNLTVTGQGGSDSEVKTGYITTTGASQPDLVITKLSTNLDEVFAHEPNTVNATVRNNGTAASGACTLRIDSAGVVFDVPISSLNPGAQQEVQVTDTTLRTGGDSVTITATVDSGLVVAESDETNNVVSITEIVVNNGYKGKRWTGGSDMTTHATFVGQYDVVYSAGNSVYHATKWLEANATWTPSDLPIPAGATVASARLYQSYAYNKMGSDPAFSASFNGNVISPVATYRDIKGYAAYSYPYGLYVYDVTSLFNTAGNTLLLTPEGTPGTTNDYSIYGAYLVVTFIDPAAGDRQILINDEFDMVYAGSARAVSSDEATVYANFSELDTSNMAGGTAVAILASAGDSGKSKFFFNSDEYTGFWTDYMSGPQIGFSVYDVTDALSTGVNEARLQSYDAGSGGDNMYAMTTILIVESTVPAPTAAFTASPLSGYTPLQVQFTDQSTGPITSYAWDFTNDGTIDSTVQNPTYTYQNVGTYTVNLTVNGFGGSDSEVKTGYITTSSPGSVNVSFSPQSHTILPGESAAYQIILDRAPQGLAGYDMVVSLQDPGVAEIVSAAFPPWATLTNTSALPNQSVRLMAADLDTQIGPGATNVLLVTISLEGTAAGTSPFTITILRMDADGGAAIQATATDGQVIVGSTVAPVAAFTADKTSGTAPLQVQFTDQSTGPITSYAWDFTNDGTIDSTDRNPAYTYPNAGTFTVNLTVTGPGGSDSEVKNNYISVTEPSGDIIADFSAAPLAGDSPLIVRFTDRSTGTITKREWDFNNDGTIDSTARNPIYFYRAPGVYSVRLVVTGPEGSDQEVKEQYITVNGASGEITADFSATPLNGNAPLLVRFTDLSTGTITKREWDFNNDGTIDSTARSPIYFYQTPGVYSVRLVVTGPDGSDEMVKEDYITVTAPVETLIARFTQEPRFGPAPLPVTFTDRSAGSPTAYLWSFGDGSTSTEVNPSHTYTSQGLFRVSLTVSNDQGSSTSNGFVFVMRTPRSP